MTNGEKIRQMTDEELADVLACDCCIYDCESLCDGGCTDGIITWLQSEVE